MAADAPGSTEPGASARPDVVDLDALRAARLEVEGRTIRFGGEDFRLLAEVPFELAEVWRTGKRMDAFRLLFADAEDADRFFALRPSWADVNAVLESYGTTAGK